VNVTYQAGDPAHTVGPMEADRPLSVARISAEASAATDLNEVCRWLIGCHGTPMRLEVSDLPELGQGTRLRLTLPVIARRAVLCALWLLEDVDAGGCLLAGQLRFVAHPTQPDIKLTFSGRTESAMRSSQLRRRADQAARQLLQLIAESIQRPAGVGPAGAPA